MFSVFDPLHHRMSKKPAVKKRSKSINACVENVFTAL